jgi:hypothetical protein
VEECGRRGGRVVCINCGRSGMAAQPPMMCEAEQRTWQAIFWAHDGDGGQYQYRVRL